MSEPTVIIRYLLDMAIIMDKLFVGIDIAKFD